jgi:uncharacterized membrane protein
MKNSRFTLYRIVIIGLMAAMVFVCTMFLGIRIPTPTGTTQLKTANAICLLTGLLFGGWTGGLAAGIGSALFDLTYPEWAAGAWLTFIFFFAMGAICGGIAHAGGAAGKNKARNWVAAICGAVGYWLLYIGKHCRAVPGRQCLFCGIHCHCSQDAYRRHQCRICHCGFQPAGSAAAPQAGIGRYL